MEKKTIGSFIAALRKTNGLTQRALAEKLNVSDKAVSRWERDECAPDLSLIPAIAEILGVTSEEIIRGERILIDPDTKGDRSDPKTEKQIERILKSTATRFKALSMISVGITVLGFLAVLFVTKVYGRCNVALFIGSAFFAAAIIFEIVLFILSYSKIDEDEFSAPLHSPYKYKMVQIIQFIITLNIVTIFFCLPLIYFSDVGLDGIYFDPYTWIKYGLYCSVVPLAICLVVIRAIRSHLIRNGTYFISEKEGIIKKRFFRLSIITVIVTALLIWMTLYTYEAIRYEVGEAFRNNVGGTTIHFNSAKEMDQFSENYDYFNSGYVQAHGESNGKDKHSYTLYTAEEINQIDLYTNLFNVSIFSLVIIEIAGGTIIYIKKRARITGPAAAKQT